MVQKTGKKALVLGIGNILLSDEGLGVRAVELFQEQYSFKRDVSCIDGGTAGLGLLSYIRDFTHIIIIDALSAKGAPGAVIRIPGSDIPAWPALKSTSAHQLGVRELLTLARFEGLNPEVTIIGIIPKDISAGLELTPEVKGSLPEAVRLITEELAAFGFKVRKKA